MNESRSLSGVRPANSTPSPAVLDNQTADTLRSHVGPKPGTEPTSPASFLQPDTADSKSPDPDVTGGANARSDRAEHAGTGCGPSFMDVPDCPDIESISDKSGPRDAQQGTRRIREMWLEPAPGKSDNAEIWRAYVREADSHDTALFKRWNDSVDVFLLFTGLFSAILSAFLIASWSSLQPDNNQATVDGLAAVSQQLVLISSGQTISTASAYQPEAFIAPWWAVTVNGLWFTSLFISLFAAILSMLVKEWLSAYNQNITPVPIERVKQRQFRYEGIKKWMLPSIVSFLPLCIHVAVFLFLLGLVVFAWPVSTSLCSLMMALLLVGVGLYLASAVAPLKFPDCPYKSPLYTALRLTGIQLRTVLDRVRQCYLRASRQSARLWLPIKSWSRRWYPRNTTLDMESGRSTRGRSLPMRDIRRRILSEGPADSDRLIGPESGSATEPISAYRFAGLEINSIKEQSLLLQARAVTWLAKSPDPEVHTLALHFLSWWSAPQPIWDDIKGDLHTAALGFLEAKISSISLEPQVTEEKVLEELALVSVLPSAVKGPSPKVRNIMQQLTDGICTIEDNDTNNNGYQTLVAAVGANIDGEGERQRVDKYWETYGPFGSQWPPDTDDASLSLSARIEKYLTLIHSSQIKSETVLKAVISWTDRYQLGEDMPAILLFKYICLLAHLLELGPTPCCSGDGDWICRYSTDLTVLEALLVKCLQRLHAATGLPSCWSVNREVVGCARDLLMQNLTKHPKLLSSRAADQVITMLIEWTARRASFSGSLEAQVSSKLVGALLQAHSPMSPKTALSCLRYWLLQEDPRQLAQVLEKCFYFRSDNINTLWVGQYHRFTHFVLEGSMKILLSWINDLSVSACVPAISVAWWAFTAVPRQRNNSMQLSSISNALVSAGWLSSMAGYGIIYIVSHSLQRFATPPEHSLQEQFQECVLFMLETHRQEVEASGLLETCKRHCGINIVSEQYKFRTKYALFFGAKDDAQPRHFFQESADREELKHGTHGRGTHEGYKGGQDAEVGNQHRPGEQVEIPIEEIREDETAPPAQSHERRLILYV